MVGIASVPIKRYDRCQVSGVRPEFKSDCPENIDIVECYPTVLLNMTLLLAILTPET
jgi:hypothetical protein